MKKITLLLFAILSSWQINAQAGAYSFTQSTEAYTPVVGTNSTAVGDDGIQDMVPIGFTFNFDGVNYTDFSINTNGWIKMGTTAIGGSGWTNSLSNTATHRPLIAPFWDDNHRNTGSIQYSLSGTAPNRVLEVGWDNVNIGGGGSTSAANFASFKLKLYETTNVIEFIYGPTMAAAGALSASIGLNGASSFLSVTPAATATASSATANDAISSTTDIVGKKYIFTPPSCSAPSGFVSTLITTNSATFSWTAATPAPANGYQYFLSTSNTPPTATSTPTGSTAAGVTTVNLTGLTPATNYFMYVRSVCSVSTSSSWSGVSTFLTLCVPVATLPWNEGFEGVTTPGTTAFPPCWLKQNGDWSTSNSTTYNTARTGTNYLRNAWSATNEYMWTPGFQLTAGVSYSFSFYAQGDGYTSWSVGTFQNTSATSVSATQIGANYSPTGPGSVAIQPYNLVTNTFVPTTSGVYYFGLNVNESTGVPWYFAFDDFKLEVTPTCGTPTALTATAITASTATLSWTAPTPAPANGYDYFVTTSTTIPTAATVPTGSVAAGVTTIALTSLLAQTTYYFWVRSKCSTTDLGSWNSRSFLTACGVAVLPFNETFTTLPLNCFSVAGAGTVATGPTGTTAGIWEPDGFLNVGSTGAVKVNLYLTNRIGWLVSPLFNLTGNTFRLSFDYGVTTWGGTTASAMGSDDSVKVLMSTDGGTTWTEISQFTVANNINNLSNAYTYNIPSTAGSNVRFALLATDGTVDDTQDYDFFVDNLRVEQSLGNTNFDNSSFTYYPNPVNDILNLSYSQTIERVSIYNLLGQEVITKTLNNNLGQIDMSNLANGTYLVKVFADNQTKTIKVLKQ